MTAWLPDAARRTQNAARKLGTSAGAAFEGVEDGGDELVDTDEAVSILVGGFAVVERSAECDIDCPDQLVDGHDAVCHGCVSGVPARVDGEGIDAAGQRVLMVVANPSVSTTLGWPVGFWAAELIHPYDALIKAGQSQALQVQEACDRALRVLTKAS